MRSAPLAGSTLFCCVFFGLTASAASAETKQVPGAAERWAKEGPGGAPEFQRHVVPTIGKLGCNNRACHGSFQDQSGFRLSLFGHDPRMDHDELVKEKSESVDGPRVNLKKPAESLALHKPTHADEHEGGERMKVGGWHYRLLHEWVAAGAPFDTKKESKLLRLEVEPSEIRLQKAGQSEQLRAVAWFSDDTFEDVTPLTLFSTNDDSVADVGEDGAVKAIGAGDTAIVATFGGAVVTSQVIVPVEDDGESPADFPPNNKIDELVLAKLNKLGIRPSELSSDETFLRRVYLDTIGTLPTPEEARAFLEDESPAKRARLIDELLERPEYAMYWATRFGDWTGNDNRFTPQPRAKTAWLWHDWLRDKLQRNVPYDEIAGGILTASTREGRSVEKTVAEHKKVAKNLDKAFDDGTYAARKTNDIFWKKSGNNRPDTAALRIGYAFLGVRLQCAQCHKHPFDRWTQDDFRGFRAVFASMGRGTPKDVPKDVNKGASRQTYKYSEVYHDDSKKAIQRLKRRSPALLGGKSIPVEDGQDPRAALWQWMRSPDNPYFAPAIVNRLWGHYFGVGIVDPVDDFNAANPPSNPALLDWLAKDFIASGFDLKHLHRTILSSRTYQLSWKPNDSNALDERNFSHALLRRMPAEVVLDAINQITGGSDRYSSSNAPKDVRTIDLAVTRLRGGGPEYVLGIFGRPLRTQTCDCERSAETGLAQAMYLLNDTDVNRKIGDPKGRLAKLLKNFDDDRRLVEELYLGALSRFPTDDEVEKSLGYVAAAESREAGMQDVMWSLMNLREFIFVH